MQPAAGTTIADRYRLERRLVDADLVTLWHGRDTILDRAVAVRLVDGDHPRAAQVLDAARSTACVDDQRVARVLDADLIADADLSAGVYVVTAWAAGTDLATLLTDGPLDIDDALALTAEVAAAVTAAHTAGIPHLALDPTNVIVGADDGGGVTLLGLAVDVALWGPTVDAGPAEADAVGLGALLYACLTARWPLPDAESSGLPAAPRMGEHRCTPRQVSAAVPAHVDMLTRRCLGEPVGDGALHSPASVALALRAEIDERAAGRRVLARRGWFGRGTRTSTGR